MRLINVFLLIFVLGAFAVGAGLNEPNLEKIDILFDNATANINNISLGEVNDTLTDGIFKIIETYTKFVGVAGLEVTKMGIFFGHENPEYFEPTFIIKILKLLVVLAIISLVITPLFYLGVIIIMIFLWAKDKYYQNKVKKRCLSGKN